MAKDKGITSRIIIELVYDDGTPLDKDNRVYDETRGLSKEEARAHHYALKSAYGQIVSAPDTQVTYSRAAGE